MKEEYIYIRGWMKDIWEWADENKLNKNIFPRDKEKLLNLKELDLSNQNLDKISKKIGRLTNLEILNLTNNNIGKFSYEFKDVYLDGIDTNKYNLPQSIGNLKNLKSLDLSNNDIKTLPPELFNLKNLKYLNLKDNPNIEIKQEDKIKLEKQGCKIQL